MISYFSLDTFRILPSSLIFNILIIMSLSMSTWVCIIETLQAPQTWISIQFSSVAQLCLTLCNLMNCSMPGLPVLEGHPNSFTSSQWCHPAISSSVIPFSSCFQSLPASGSFPMSQLFTWGGQSIGISASASVLPMNTQNWSPLGSLLPPSKLKSFSITISSNNFSNLFSFISGTPSLMWMLFCLILS